MNSKTKVKYFSSGILSFEKVLLFNDKIHPSNTKSPTDKPFFKST